MTDPFTIRFSLEELVYLLHALKLTTIHGLPEHPLEPLDADHQALALAVADRALRARSIVYWKSPEMRHVDSTIAGLITSYGQSQSVLTIDAYLPVSSLPVHTDWVFGKRFAIDHIQVERGVHQFFAVNNVADVLERLEQIMPLTETIGNGMAARLSQQTLQAAQQLAHQDQTRTGAMLATELPVATANGLAAVLAQPEVTYNLTLLLGKNNTGASMKLITGKRGLYVLSQQNESFLVTPVTLQQARRQTSDFLQPMLAQMPAQG